MKTKTYQSPKPTATLPLLTWVWRSYFRTALAPLLLVEVVIISVYLAANHLATEENLDAVRELANDELRRIAHRESVVIQRQLEAVSRLTELFRRRTAEIMAGPLLANPEEEARYGYSPTGVYYSRYDNGGGALFYSGAVPVGQAQREKALVSARLDPLMKTIQETHPLVAAVYYNTHDSLNRIYPYFDVLEQYPAGMDIPSYNFYYEADAAHNPGRGVVWTEVYVDPAGQGWMASCIAPVYQGEALEGVVGLDITVASIVATILDLTIPWGGYGVLIGKDGALLALPEAGEADWGLEELTTHHYTEAILQDTFKPEEFNVFTRPELGKLAAAMGQGDNGVLRVTLGGPQLAAWGRIPETGWTLLVLAPEANIYARASALGQRLLTIGALMIGGLVLFYLVFFMVLYRRARTMTHSISRPLAAIDGLVERIGVGDYQQRAPTFPVSELRHTAQGVVAMGEQLGAANRRLLEAKSALHRQTDFQQLLIDTVPAPLFYTDATGRFRGCNLSFERFTGQRDGSNNQTLVANLLAGVEKGGPGVATQETRLENSAGETLDVMFTRAAFYEPDGSPGGFVGVLIDVTERHRTQRKAERARDEALETSRLKSEFLAAISHEIRTPMNGVIGMIDLLLDSPLNLEQREFAITIQNSAQSLLNVINDILDFSKIEAGRVELSELAFSPATLVESVAEVLAPLAHEKRLKLTTIVDRAVPSSLLGDAGRLRQVLLNLLGNAVKFTDQEAVAVGLTVEGGGDHYAMMRFTISDTGMGVAREARTRLFQPFTQVDGSLTRRHGGTGLGLSICKRLVELMGGEIGLVDSDPGQGACFWFRVPLKRAAGSPVAGSPVADPAPGSGLGARVAKAAVQPADLAPSPPPSSANSTRILLAEDNEVNQKVAVSRLRKLGHRVDVVDNGQGAVECALKGCYDLILMDIQMPVMDGVDATRRIREAQRDKSHRSHIVAVTANAMPGDRERFIDAGMDDYLSKPYRLEQLQAVLERWLPAEREKDAAS